MGFRSRRPQPIEGGSRRASINLAPILGAAGVGGQAANPGFVAPDAGPGAVPFDYAGDPSEFLTSAENVPYQNQSFMGRLMGNPDLNADYRANVLNNQVNSLYTQKNLTAADQIQAGAERRRDFAKYSGGASESEVDPALVEQFKRGYAAAMSEQALTAALAGGAENRGRVGTATRNEELGALAHPYNKTLTTTEGVSKNMLATGRQANIPAQVAAEGSTFRQIPRKNMLEIANMSVSPWGNDRLLRTNPDTGAMSVSRFPTPEEGMIAAEEGRPAPGVDTTNLDQGFVTLADGTKIPVKNRNSWADDILGNTSFKSTAVTGKTDEPPPPPTRPNRIPPRVTQLQPPVLEGDGLLPSSVNVPELGRRIGNFIKPEPSNLSHAMDFKMTPTEWLDFWRGKAPAPGVVGPQIQPPLPMPKRPNYR